MATLGGIEKIAQNIKNSRFAAVRALHIAAYGEEGRSRLTRRNLRAFSGFNLERESNEYQVKAEEIGSSLDLSDLTAVCHILNLDYEGQRDDIVNRICSFLNDLSVNDDVIDENDEGQTEDEAVRDLEDTDESESEDESDGGNSAQLQTRVKPRAKKNNSFALTFRDVEDTIRPFDGKDDYPIEKWIQDFEEIAEIMGWNDLQKLIFAKKALTGLAKLFVQSEKGIKSWNTLKKKLTEEFEVKISSAQVHKQLMSRKKGYSETVQEYVLVMREIGSRAMLEAEVIIQYIIDGIEDDTSSKIVLYGARSFAEFKEKVKLYEQIRTKKYTHCSEKSRLPRRKNEEKEVKKEEHHDRRGKPTNCFNCGLRGHKSSGCPDRTKGIKCYSCNDFGHVSAKCPKRKSNTNENHTSANVCIVEAVPKNSVRVQIDNVQLTALLEHDFKEKTAAKDDELHKLQLLHEETLETVDGLNKDIENLKLSFEASSSEASEAHRQRVEKMEQEIDKMRLEDQSAEHNFALQSEEKSKIIQDLNKILAESNAKIELLERDLQSSAAAEESSRKAEQKLQEELEAHIEKSNLLAQDLQGKTNESKSLLEAIAILKANFESRGSAYDSLQSEFTELKQKSEAELRVKIDEIKTSSGDIAEHKNLIHSLQNELQSTKLDLETASKDLQQYQNNLSDVESQLKTERDKLHDSLKEKITECDHLRKELSDVTAQKDLSLTELENALKATSESCEKLKSDLMVQKEVAEKSTGELVDNHKKALSDKDESVSSQNAEIKKNEEEILRLNSQVSTLELAIANSAVDLDKLKSDMQKREAQGKVDGDTIESLKAEVEGLKATEIELDNRTREVDLLKQQRQTDKNSFELELNSKISELTQSAQDADLQRTELLNLREEVANSNTQGENLIKEIEQSKKIAADLETLLSSTRGEFNTQLEDKTKALEVALEEISTLTIQLGTKSHEVESISAELTQLRAEKEAQNQLLLASKEEIARVRESMQGKLADEDHLQRQAVELNSEISSKTSELFKVKSDLMKVVSELEGRLEEANKGLAEKTELLHLKEDEMILITENQKTFIKELIEDHKKKTSEVNGTIEKSEGLLQEKLEEVKQLNLDAEMSKASLAAKGKECDKLKEELSQLSADKTKVSSDLSQHANTVESLQTQNRDYSSKINQLEDQICLLTSQNHSLDQQTAGGTSIKLVDLEKQLKETGDLVELMKLENKELQDFNKGIVHEYEEKIKTAEYSETLLRNVVEDLQNDLSQTPALKTSIENLQREIALRDITLAGKEGEIGKLKSQLEKMQSPVANGAGGDDALLEDKIFAQKQVDFLNSIIVDMQRKNDEQKARIEILEMGYSPAATEELRQLGFKSDFQRQTAPRIYCDICEHFDLHETEDCPTQGSEEPVSNYQLGKEKKEKPPPRPYCEICGEFGHDTADCTDDQEF